jgi:hypothetical protein
MRVVATPDAVEFIRTQGGHLWVWPRYRVRPGLVPLETATERPPGDMEFVLVAGPVDFRLLFDSRGWGEPDFLEVDLRGWRRRRVGAFWNGLAYVR